MSDIRAGVLLSLKDQFSAGLRRAGTEASGFGSSVVSALDKVNSATSGVSAKLAGLGLTVGAGFAVNGVIDLQARMERLGTAMNAPTEKMDELKQKIFAAAQSPDIKIDPSSIIDAIDQIGERTGDMKFAEENIRSIGLAIQATGATGDDIGGLFAEFQKMGMGADESRRALDALTKQGKEGAFTLQNLAGLGPRTISAYAATGRSGETALREMGAALQVIRMGTGSSEQAATAFEAVMRNLTDPAKQKELKKLGVTVRDQAGQFKPVTAIMSDIVVKSKGSIEKIGSLFDAEAVRGFNSAISEYKRTGGVESLQKFLAMQSDGSMVLADSARNAHTLKANIQNLQGAFAKFADKNLTGPLESVAATLNNLAEDPEKVQRVFMGVAAGIAAVTAVKGLATVVGLVSNLKGLKGGKTSLGLTAGLAGGAQPVLVTNWPAGGLLGGESTAGVGLSETAVPAAGIPSSRLQAVSGAFKQAGKAGLIGGALYAGAGLVSTLTNKDLSREEKFKGSGGAVGGGLGVWGGTALGAAIGTAILPGVGTAIGAALGGAIGAFAGQKGGEFTGGFIAQKTARPGLPPVDAATSRTLQGGGSLDAARGSMLPAAPIKVEGGKVQIDLRATRDPGVRLDIGSVTNTIPGSSVNTGRAQDARYMP